MPAAKSRQVRTQPLVPRPMDQLQFCAWGQIIPHPGNQPSPQMSSAYMADGMLSARLSQLVYPQL